MLWISRKLVMFKVKSIYGEKCGSNEAIKDAFIDKNFWLVKIMSHNYLSLRMKITVMK